MFDEKPSMAFVAARKPLRMMLVQRRAIARRPRIRLAHVGAFSRVPVEAVTVRANAWKVINVRASVDPNNRICRTMSGRLSFEPKSPFIG